MVCQIFQNKRILTIDPGLALVPLPLANERFDSVAAAVAAAVGDADGSVLMTAQVAADVLVAVVSVFVLDVVAYVAFALFVVCVVVTAEFVAMSPNS